MKNSKSYLTIQNEFKSISPDMVHMKEFGRTCYDAAIDNICGTREDKRVTGKLKLSSVATCEKLIFLAYMF